MTDDCDCDVRNEVHLTKEIVPMNQPAIKYAIALKSKDETIPQLIDHVQKMIDREEKKK